MKEASRSIREIAIVTFPHGEIPGVSHFTYRGSDPHPRTMRQAAPISIEREREREREREVARRTY